MSDKQDAYVRIEEETRDVIKHNLVGLNREFESITEFFEKSVSKQIGDVNRIVSDGDTLRKVIRRLNKIDGINEPKPECKTTAQWGEEDLNKSRGFELKPRTLNQVDQVVANSGLDNSKIYRICIFKLLFERARGDEDVFEYSSTADEIKIRWGEIYDALISPPSKFHRILKDRFLLKKDWNMDLYEPSQKEFEQFAKTYKNEFYYSDMYHKIENQHGEEALIATENTIEKITTVEFDRRWVDTLMNAGQNVESD